MKAAAAWKAEDRAHDLAAGAFHRFQCRLQVIGIEDDERTAGAGCIEVGKAALQPSIVEFAVVGTVIGKTPPESLAVKRLGAFDIGDVELDIVMRSSFFEDVIGSS